MGAPKIRRDDLVEVISGKDAGKQGKVLHVDPRRDRLYVEGLNVVKRHQRPRSLKDTQQRGKIGGVVEKEGPIHISNVMLVDPASGKRSRVGIERDASGKRVRVAKQSGTKLEK
jgi:large subunit ribosomal protein L24